MTLTSAIAIYFVIWWIVLFAVLPFGVRTQEEDESIVPGSNESAPIQPFLLRKAIATTIVSAVVFGILYWLVAIVGIGLDDFWFIPDFEPRISESAQ